MITDPKRKRCSIELCEGYCDDTTISVICDSCSAENRNLRFCPMHVPHVSHSGQLGFIDQPLAVHPVPLLQAEVQMNPRGGGGKGGGSRGGGGRTGSRGRGGSASETVITTDSSSSSSSFSVGNVNHSNIY